MDYGMISKIYKARRYAEERKRFRFTNFSVEFRGDNATHTVSYKDEGWSCDCETFELRSVCSHTMAIERLLGEMIEQPN